VKTLQMLLGMSRTFFTIFRPVACATAAAGVIVSAAVATGNLIPTVTVQIAAVAMALLVLACSFYHTAFQNHSQPYTRHVHDFVGIQLPYFWGIKAFIAFLGSFYLSAHYLPISCTVATASAGGLIVLYTARRGTNGPLNSMVALVCTTPVLIGWIASGTRFSWTPILLMVLTYWLFLIRENSKDQMESSALVKRLVMDGSETIATSAVITVALTILLGKKFSMVELPTWLVFALLLHYVAFISSSMHRLAMTAFIWEFMGIALILSTNIVPMG